jgi:cytokinin dehydrogenase
MVVGFNGMTGSWVTLAGRARRGPFENLPPLDGVLSLDAAIREKYAQDYGQIVHEQPLAVLQPASVEDIVRMVRFARRFGLRIAARGQGHLPFGQAQVGGGIVIDLRSLRTDSAIAGDRIEVDAGADWRSVVEAALSYGRTPPVLPAYLGLTVGGTLSIGGVGSTSFRRGAQIDHVLELQVVTGSGEIVTCSEVENRDLFETVLAGQGQVAIITRAVVPLIPASTKVRTHVLQYGELSTLLHDGARISEEGRFDAVAAFLTSSNGQWSYSLEASSYFTPPRAPDAASLLAGLGHVPDSGSVRIASYIEHINSMPTVEFGSFHADLAMSIPGSAAASFIGDMLTRLAPGDLGTASAVRVSFWKRQPFGRPLFRVPREANSVYIVVQRTETTDREVVARMLEGNRELFERNRALGGTLYPYSALELSRSDWRRHYGEQWPTLVRAKGRYDPDRVLASGPDLFLPPRARTSD